MSVEFEEECLVTFLFDYRLLATKVIDEALEYEECPYEAEVNLTITSDEEIRLMNKEFRNIDRATDVLSFPMTEFEIAGDFSFLEKEETYYFHPETGELILGDIVISIDKVLEQAEAYGHLVEREFAFLVAHSMLHLMGYDHMDPTEASIMEEKQEAILAQLKISRRGM